MTAVPPKKPAARAGAPGLDLHIDELVLHGFTAADRYEIAATVERELARLFRGGNAPAPWLHRLAGGGDAVLYRLDAGAFDVPHDAPPQAIGSQIAQAIHQGLGGGPEGDARGPGPASTPSTAQSEGKR